MGNTAMMYKCLRRFTTRRGARGQKLVDAQGRPAETASAEQAMFRDHLLDWPMVA